MTGKSFTFVVGDNCIINCQRGKPLNSIELLHVFMAYAQQVMVMVVTFTTSWWFKTWMIFLTFGWLVDYISNVFGMAYNKAWAQAPRASLGFPGGPN